MVRLLTRDMEKEVFVILLLNAEHFGGFICRRREHLVQDTLIADAEKISQQVGADVLVHVEELFLKLEEKFLVERVHHATHRLLLGLDRLL